MPHQHTPINTPHPLLALGWDQHLAADLAEALTSEAHPGRVTRVDRRTCTVTLADGDHQATSRGTTDLPAVGDWVTARWDTGTLLIDHITPRRSQLTRRDPQGRIQVLASNIDLVLITAPADRLSPARVERETAMAWDSGAQPVVILTKHDLASPDTLPELAERLIGVDIIATSTLTRHGIDQITNLLRPHRTAVLLGPSGAGKSSLANALLGTNHLTVGAVRGDDRRGRHTTTHRQLLTVPTGGVLIDTPGLRSLSLAGQDGIAATFRDIDDLARGCRFTDCQHQREPHCAVHAAVDAGQLDPARLANYHKLLREQQFQIRRDDPVARAEAERIWRIRAKAGRQLARDRDRGTTRP